MTTLSPHEIKSLYIDYVELIANTLDDNLLNEYLVQSTVKGDTYFKPMALFQFSELLYNKESRIFKKFYPKNNLPPQPLEVIDWAAVIEMAKSIVEEIEKGTYHEDNDNEHYMWEEVLKAVFGEDFFDWFNKNV